MADQATPLSADDYKQLYDMSLSTDDGARTQAASLSKKLTPTEQKEFFDYQQSQTKGAELHRADNSIGGVPPELVAAGAIPVVSALSGVGSIGVKAAQGLKAALSQGAPVVKYQIAKSGLEHLGVPTPIAMAAAYAVSGYRSGNSSATGGAEDAAPAATAVVKPSFNARETAHGLMMMKNGVPEQDAMAAILKLRAIRGGQ